MPCAGITCNRDVFSQWNGKGVREKYMNEKREENYSLAVHCMLLFMLSFLTS